MNKNIQLPENFKQVCVWPGTILNDDQIEDFVKFFKDDFNTRVVFLETLVTGPDKDEAGNTIQDTGGRHDVIFAVHNDDVMSFAIPRFSIGVKWIEDFIDNGGLQLHPARINEYRHW